MEGCGGQTYVIMVTEQRPREQYQSNTRHGKDPHSGVFLLRRGPQVGIQSSPERDIKAFACLGKTIQRLDIECLG